MSDTDIIWLIVFLGVGLIWMPFWACRLTITKVDIVNAVVGGSLLLSGIACALVRWLI